MRYVIKIGTQYLGSDGLTDSQLEAIKVDTGSQLSTPRLVKLRPKGTAPSIRPLRRPVDPIAAPADTDTDPA